jgi:hypothetical protein
MSGVESSGFVTKTLAQIIEDIRSRVLATLMPYAQFLPSQALTQITDIFADGSSTLWEGLNALYNASYLTAEGVSLDLVASMLGKRRNEAKKAYMMQFKVVTSEATTIPLGSRFGSTVTGAPVFETQEEITIDSATTTRIKLFAVDAGAIGYSYSGTLAGTYTQNLDSVANISSVENDGTTTFQNGTDRETDGELRARLQNAYNNSNIYTLDAYKQAILALNDSLTETGNTPIEDCFTISNTSNYVDSDGRPAKSIEVVVYYDGSPDSATDTAISTRIATVTQGATETCSTTALSYSKDIVINENTVFPVTFSRADEVDIILSIAIEKSDGTVMTADEKSALKTYIAAWGNLIGLGNDVVIYGRNSISQALNEYTSLDIVDYTIQAGRPTLGGANITIENTEISRFSTANITLTDL